MFPPFFPAPPSSSSFTTATLYNNNYYRYTIFQDFAITLTHIASIPNAHVLDYLCYAFPFFIHQCTQYIMGIIFFFSYLKSYDSTYCEHWGRGVCDRNRMKANQERYRFAENCFYYYY